MKKRCVSLMQPRFILRFNRLCAYPGLQQLHLELFARTLDLSDQSVEARVVDSTDH